MNSWNRVENKINDEKTKIQEYSGGDPENITCFYPELVYRTNSDSAWTSTGHLPLIASALTSPHTLVDIYDWKTEEELIAMYGVDLEFLYTLRDKGHISLMANLPPERYKKDECNWLHPILSSSETIWRSIRTPSFYTTLSSGVEDYRDDMEQKLIFLFKNMNGDRFKNICELFGHEYISDALVSLPRVLSVHYMYVLVHDSIMANATWGEFLSNPEDKINDIKRLYLMYATPYSVALGGTPRILENQWLPYFEENSRTHELPDNTEIKAVHEYIMKLSTGLITEDIHTKQYWMSISNAKKKEIIKLLEDPEERRDLFVTERNLRHLLYKNEDIRNSLENVENYVDRLKDHYELISKGLKMTFGVSALALLADSLELSNKLQLSKSLMYLSVPYCLPHIDSALLGVPNKVLESFVTSLQVVRFARGK